MTKTFGMAIATVWYILKNKSAVELNNINRSGRPFCERSQNVFPAEDIYDQNLQSSDAFMNVKRKGLQCENHW